MKKSGFSRTYIGLNDIKNEGTWIWADGTPHELSELEWSVSQPDNHGGVQDCAVYSRAFGWSFDDLDCTTTENFLCEHVP